MKDMKMNVLILFFLTLCTFGIYGFIWLARVAKSFKDDPLTVVALSLASFGVMTIFFHLRYMAMSHKLNGRDMAWYEVFFALFGMGTVIVQLNLNEHIANQG